MHLKQHVGVLVSAFTPLAPLAIAYDEIVLINHSLHMM